jgi:hypothetical protein
LLTKVINDKTFKDVVSSLVLQGLKTLDERLETRVKTLKKERDENDKRGKRQV